MFAILFRIFRFIAPKSEIIWLSNLYILSVPDWVDTTAGGLLVPAGIILPEVSVSALTCFI